MAQLIAIDGASGEGSGQILRAALALATVTGQGFEITRIRANRLRPGLRPPHVAAVRAAAMISGARASGAFEGSPDMRFEPGVVTAGEFRFDIGGAGAATLVAQAVIPPLATAVGKTQIELTGGTHVPASPPFEYMARHWLALLERLGLKAQARLVKAGFYPKAGGEIRIEVSPWSRPASLQLTQRGRLLELRGVSGAGRLKGDVAERQRDAAAAVLWERRRLEVQWETLNVASGSPGSFLMLEAVFESSRGAVSLVGERGVRPEAVGERVAGQMLQFLDAEGAVDPHAADQLVVPLALARGGGVVTTTEVTRHLETVAGIVSLFGIPARVEGLRGGAGVLDVAAH